MNGHHLIDEDTTFIVQGITGREAVNLTRECLDYGSKIVGGVTPGRRGREVHGVPVFDSVAQLVEAEGGKAPDGSVGLPAMTRCTWPPAIIPSIASQMLGSTPGASSLRMRTWRPW